MSSDDPALDALAASLAPKIAKLLALEDTPARREQPMTLRELAAYTSVSRSTLAELARAGQIPSFRAGRRMFFLASEVMAALREADRS